MLGTAHDLWVALHADLSADFAPLTGKWSFSGAAHGWLLQLRQKRRTVLYLVPGQGCFVASFALSENACEAARASALPKPVLDVIAQATKYSEGRGVRIDVRKQSDLANVTALAAIKMAN